VPPDHLNPKLSTGFAEVIERAMAKDRDQRYASTADLLVDLERVARGEAPLQARSAFQDELLENLADGQAESVADRQSVEKPAYTNLLIGGMVAEAVVILVLIIVLIMK
jgi:hypothetical protein